MPGRTLGPTVSAAPTTLPASVLARTLAARSAYAALAGLDPGLPVDVARRVMVRRLTEVTRADHVQFWVAAPDDSGLLRPAICWPPDSAALESVDPALLDRLPGVQAFAALSDEGQVHVGLTLHSQRRIGRAPRRELNDTANCLMVLHRREQLRTQLRRQLEHTAQLAGEVLDSSRRLAGVRELERRRVAAEVIIFSQSRLTALQDAIDRLSDAPEPGLRTAQLDRLRPQLERLIADFRVLVRGIHPQVLYRSGLRAALTELAAGYPGRVRITGWAPARIDHELAASLYYLSAAAMTALTRSHADLDIVLEYRRLPSQAAGLQVQLQARADLEAAQVRAALAVDADRLGALGGWVRVGAQDARVQVLAWVPDRLEPAPRAALATGGSLYAQVRAHAFGQVAQPGEGPGPARARRLLSRLDEPVHVAVIQPPKGRRRVERIIATQRARPDLVLAPVQPETVVRTGGVVALHGDLSMGMMDAVPDVVVRPHADAPEQRFDVVLPGGRALRTGAAWPDLAEVLTVEVVARADVLRARTALAALLRLARSGPLEPGLLHLRDTAPDLIALESGGPQGGGPD